MTRLLIILIAVFISGSAMSQIGGLSASKLASLTTKTVDYKKIEFEPGFFHSRSGRYWDSNGELKNIYATSDSLTAVSGMYFRFTYGLWKDMEAGFSISSDLSIAQLGFMYQFLKKSKFGLAGIAGVNIPLGTRTIDQRVRATSNLMQLGVGIVTTYDFTENLSLDFTGSFMRFIKETEERDKGGFYLNTDLGYYLFDHQLQIVGAAAYQYIKDEKGSHQVFTINPGVTIETGKKFIIVVSFPYDVYGKRESKNTAVNFALTLVFD